MLVICGFIGGVAATWLVIIAGQNYTNSQLRKASTEWKETEEALHMRLIVAETKIKHLLERTGDCDKIPVGDKSNLDAKLVYQIYKDYLTFGMTEEDCEKEASQLRQLSFEALVSHLRSSADGKSQKTQ